MKIYFLEIFILLLFFVVMFNILDFGVLFFYIVILWGLDVIFGTEGFLIIVNVKVVVAVFFGELLLYVVIIS